MVQVHKLPSEATIKSPSRIQAQITLSPLPERKHEGRQVGAR